MAENDLYRMSVEGRLWANTVVVTFGFLQSSVTGGFLGQQLIDDFQANALTELRACSTTDLVWDWIRVRDVVPGTSASAEENMTTNNAGTGLAPTQSNQVASIVSWYTNRSGRSYRGRTYIPALSSASVSAGGTISGAALTALNAFRTKMINTYGASSSGSFKLVIISHVNNGLPRPSPIGTLVQSGQVRTIAGTQRRRRLGVGA